MRRRLALSALASLAVVHFSLRAAEKRVVTFDDVLNMKIVGTPQISPDGRSVLYTIRQWEPASGETTASQAEQPSREDETPSEKKERQGRMEARTHVWQVAADGSSPARQLTFGERGESQPRWSPDGQYVSFLAARGRTQTEGDGPPVQIWLMRRDGGEAWQLTSVKDGVTTYAWSPNSSQIAFTAREPLSREEDEKRKRRDDARVFEGDFRYTHLSTIDIASKAAVPVTTGRDYTIRGELAWSSDSSRVAFTAAPTPLLRDEREDIYIATVKDRNAEKVTTSPGRDNLPAWSPDGRSIAYVSEPAGSATPEGIPLQRVANARLMLYDVAKGESRDVSSTEFDRSPGAPLWTPDGRHVLFAAGRRAYREMFAYDLETRRYEQLTTEKVASPGNVVGGRGTNGARPAHVAGLVTFTMDSAETPADVYVSDAQFAAPQRVTDANPQVRDLTLGPVEVITWKSSDGLSVEGLLLKPVNYAAGKRYPLLVVVHGGPTSVFVNSFRATAGDAGQHWAGQGWAVLYPNPRGSTNYGEKFMQGNVPDWGGGDYRDIMSGVDAVIERGVADPDRLAVMGWSYGGYMTCWIVSQTDRFRAAMMGAGLSNLWSMYGTNDIPSYMAAFFKDIPTKETLPLYLERSGLTFADRVKTPLLILHGANDERVPTGQAMEFYRALKDRGKTVELVFYPRAGHGLTEYYHQLDRLKRQFEWITKYTLGGSRVTSLEAAKQREPR